MKLTPTANPPHRWSGLRLDYDEVPPPPADLVIFEERARTILSANDSPDISFKWSLNPYRGCFHGCAYCYARPSHSYWDFGAGTDFERKIVVKVNAPEKLRESFLKPSWSGEVVAFSGNTDCYQPLEIQYELTRRCLEVCLEFRNPVGIITKGSIVRRDVDLLAALARTARASVYVSIPFADEEMARALEPWAPSPKARFDTLRILSEAGIPTGVSISPIIPGLNDSQIAEVLERAALAGATRAFHILLRLPNEVKPIFFERLAAAYPDRVDKVRNGIKAVRGGAINDSRFGHRMTGAGPRWEAARYLFDSTCRRLGLNGKRQTEFDEDVATTFRRPGDQLGLFETPAG
ncbi:MAG: PA0069 family radical SAM protein [Candidatus Eisenbacteria bacterium]|nr:PA0069 family radical SAM protein [Candidatus Eisenbacteria bacterium]